MINKSRHSRVSSDLGMTATLPSLPRTGRTPSPSKLVSTTSSSSSSTFFPTHQHSQSYHHHPQPVSLQHPRPVPACSSPSLPSGSGLPSFVYSAAPSVAQSQLSLPAYSPQAHQQQQQQRQQQQHNSHHQRSQSYSKQFMHSSTLSVAPMREPMRSVPSPVTATLSPVGHGTSAATSSADYSRTHGHTRNNSLATSRRPSMDPPDEKPSRPSLSSLMTHGPGGHGSHAAHGYHQTRVPSPLTGPPHFPPAWSHHIYGEAQCPPRSRPPILELLVHAIRDRLASRSQSGSLGRGLMLGWVLTTLGFVAATAFWKGELFAALDNLSKSLYDMGYQGLVVFGILIFITTIPPLPLYSTLIVLSGYTFGVWNGFVASYLASLVGAVVVFIVSRTLLRDAVTRSLASSPTATSLLQIIPQNPHLLLLIRIAPYPYNLLNVVLASAPSLTLQTYTFCTAISLCKLVLHTWIGAGIHDISAAYSASPSTPTDPSTPPTQASPEDLQHERVKAGVTWGGIILCGVLFVYLTHVAKRAIAKAQDEQRIVREEEVAFLTPLGAPRDIDSE